MLVGRRCTVYAGAALIATLALGPGRASAGVAGQWNLITDTGISNISEVGLARTPDGTLHAAWSVQQGDDSEELVTAPVTPSGAGAGTAVVSAWASIDNPALGLAPGGGLQAFFGGIHTLASTDPHADENLATSTDGGLSWSLTAADVVAPGAAAYASQVAVSNSFAAQTSPFETWTGTSGVWVHAGTGSGTANADYQTALGGCCGYYANLAADATGNTELAWYSNASGRGGIWAQAVSSSGAASGSPQQMPKTASLGVGELQRTPIVARPQGGFYVAYPIGYPSFTGVELWKVGGSALKIAGAHVPAVAGDAVDQDGRVWVFWSSNIGHQPQLFATRSNPSVTRLGAIVAIGSPAHTTGVFSIDGNASKDGLDLFTTESMSGGTANASIWARHVDPGLSVTLAPSAAKLDHAAKVTVDVNDAGVPVRNATVKLGGHTVKTNAAGRARIELTASGALTAVASHSGYVKGSARLRVKR
ncbi:MAG TPA: hypothetical protein VHU61_08620 [Solirubrobacteraceae bacterium]|nr:hypothetical protein [Solirubrobacteraceae bacterium]